MIPCWWASLVSWFRLLAMPTSCLTKCLSSSLILDFTSPLIAIVRMYSVSLNPALPAFCRTIKCSVLLNLVPVIISFFTAFLGLPGGSFFRLFGLSIIFIFLSFETNGSKSERRDFVQQNHRSLLLILNSMPVGSALF